MCREKRFDLLKRAHKSRGFVTMLVVLVLVFSVFALSGCGARKEDGAGKQGSAATEQSMSNPNDWNLFNAGLAAVRVGDKWGYINEQGEMVIEPQYDYVYDFTSCGLAVVGNLTDNGYKWSCIDTDGNVAFETDYDYMEGLYHGKYFLVEKDEKEGIIDTEGNVVLEPQKFSIEEFEEWRGGPICVEKKDKYGFVNLDGSYVVEPKYYLAENFASNGLALVEMEEKDSFESKCGYIDVNGNVVIDLQYEYAESFSENGLASVRKNGKDGFINEKGELVVEPQYDYTEPFEENGLAVVEIDGKRALIDSNGEYVVEPIYISVENFSGNGLALVYVSKKGYGYINREGEFVIEPQFKEAGNFADNGLAMVRVDKKWCYINSAGEYVIPPEYKFLSYFANGKIWAGKEEKTYIISETGEILKEIAEDEIGEFIQFFDDGYALVARNDKKIAVVNPDGEVIGLYDGAFGTLGGMTKDDFCQYEGCTEVLNECQVRRYCSEHKKSKRAK